jgi:hypothetical protein
MMRRSLFATGLLTSLVSLSATAGAHVSLTSIDGQTGVARAEAPAENLKNAPCGQNTNGRTATVTQLTAGDTVTLVWDEYIDHPGFFRIAFDNDGDDGFPAIADMDDVHPAQCTLQTCLDSSETSIQEKYPVGDTVLAYVADGTNMVDITVPNVDCTNCTLQVIQFMTDKLANNNDDEIYYQCADIEISGATAGGGAGGAGGQGGAGGATAGAGGAGGAATAGAGGTGGTATAGAGGASAGAGGAAMGTAGTATAGSGGSVAAAGSSSGAGGGLGNQGSTSSGGGGDSGGCALSGTPGNAQFTLLTFAAAALGLGLGRRRKRS